VDCTKPIAHSGDKANLKTSTFSQNIAIRFDEVSRVLQRWVLVQVDWTGIFSNLVVPSASPYQVTAYSERSVCGFPSCRLTEWCIFRLGGTQFEALSDNCLYWKKCLWFPGRMVRYRLEADSHCAVTTTPLSNEQIVSNFQELKGWEEGYLSVYLSITLQPLWILAAFSVS
jgi:hypothetical protein